MCNRSPIFGLNILCGKLLHYLARACLHHPESICSCSLPERCPSGAKRSDECNVESQVFSVRRSIEYCRSLCASYKAEGSGNWFSCLQDAGGRLIPSNNHVREFKPSLYFAILHIDRKGNVSNRENPVIDDVNLRGHDILGIQLGAE